MSFEERNSLSGLAASLLALSLIGGALWQGFCAGVFDRPDGPMFWPGQMLWPIGVGVILAILLLVMDWPEVGVLMLFVASCAIGDSLGADSGVWRYRRGF